MGTKNDLTEPTNANPATFGSPQIHHCRNGCGRGTAPRSVSPSRIDTQIAREVVAGDEEAYADIAKTVPIGRAGRPEENRFCRAVAFQSGSKLRIGHALTVDGGMTVQ